MRRSFVAAVLIAAAGVSNAAHAQLGNAHLGTLTCTVGDRDAKAPDERRAMRCAFRPGRDGAEQHYAGTIRKLGSEKLPDAKVVLIWVVRGPEGVETKPGFLEQTFVGQPSDAAPGAGAILSGQRDRTIVLHASTAGAPSDRASVTVVDLELKSVPA